MIALTAVALAMTMSTLPKLTVHGMELVDPQGKRVPLRGCNLGNWLVIEPWMLALSGSASDSFKDQHEFEEILRSRFGNDERERLMDLYRSHWITERDFPIIRSFGFNVVRLPMNYRLMEDDANPKKLRKDAWQWIDKAVDLAEKHGLYTILDMHGVQGGQSVYDHTGRVGQNKLWTEVSNQERLAWLWGEIAKRYRSRTAVVAYDVFNEPYGGSHEGQRTVFTKALNEIRRFDPDKLVYAHGHYDGFEHYGAPKANGWSNVGYQMHYYPGLFGNGEPTVLTHAKHLQSLDRVAEKVRKLDVPFLVGEMNVVFKNAGGASMMRRTYDAHARHGWATTMWAYKVLSREGGIGNASWGMVTSAKPARSIDIRTATKAEIEAWMKGFSTEPYEVYEELRKALTDKDPVLPPLPEIPKPITETPHQDVIEGWLTADVGGSRKGGVKKEADGFVLFGGGNDIWGHQDQFRFLYRQVTGGFTLGAEVDEMPDGEQYAKAGLMIRSALDPDAATFLLSVFPGGQVQVATRAGKGKEMVGSEGAESSFPLRMTATRRGNRLTFSFSSGREPMQKAGEVDLPEGPLLVGMVALSHDNSQLIPVRYRNVRLSQP